MTLPYSDPSNPALPSPLFSDLTAVRADHMRANNAAIFADLAFLDANNPALVALTGGSFKTAALANANTYNGRSTFSCAAGVSDTPYAGVWHIAGIWNPTDSSGRFVAMLDSSNETWEITYSGAAWGAWALVGYGETAFARKAFVQSMGGVWCDFVWVGSTQIIIKPKAINGQTAFIGVVLNNGKYIETTTAITGTLTPAGAGGHIIDGITAVLNNEWYDPWFYENSSGELAVGFTWMPQTTFSTNNPTNLLALNQVNSQNVGFLFNPGASIRVWNSSAKFETWLYNTIGGYTPTGEKNIASRTATELTLNTNLGVANFSAGDYVAQLDNFKPLQISDGAIASVIGARGYRDSGIRLRTDGSANILKFSVSGKLFAFDVKALIYNTASLGTFLNSYCPIDKENAWIFCHSVKGSGEATHMTLPYWSTNYDYYRANQIQTDNTQYNTIKHGLQKMDPGASTVFDIYGFGYEI